MCLILICLTIETPETYAQFTYNPGTLPIINQPLSYTNYPIGAWLQSVAWLQPGPINPIVAKDEVIGFKPGVPSLLRDQVGPLSLLGLYNNSLTGLMPGTQYMLMNQPVLPSFCGLPFGFMEPNPSLLISTSFDQLAVLNNTFSFGGLLPYLGET